MASITQAQLQDIFKKADASGQKLDRAQIVQELVNRGNTIEGLNEPVKKKTGLGGLLESSHQEMKEYKAGPNFFKTISSYIQAPGNAMAGALQKYVVAPVAGAFGAEGLKQNALSTPEAVKLSENVSKSADVARVGIPAAAAFATGGLSIPASMAVSGIVGASSSLLASGLEKAAGEEQTATGAAGEAVATGTVDALLDGATRGLFRLAKPLLKAKGAKDLSKEASNTVGKIVQSKNAREIEQGRKAIQSLGDTKGIKTFEDLNNTVSEKLATLRTAQDEVLDAVPARYTIDQLGTTVKVEGKEATDNFVKSALDGLEELYKKTGNTEAMLRIQVLRETAEDPLRGLTTRQINDIAREYGRGFKAFSDATGQPLTSVNAKMYENTRKGLKGVSRRLMPNDAAKVIDEEMSNLITLEEMSKDMTEAAQQLTNKIEERNLFQKAVASLGGGVDMMLGRAPSSFFSSLLVRGNVGMKQLNSLQIQKRLPKNLAKLQELLRTMDNLPDEKVVAALQEIMQENVRKGTDATLKAGAGATANYFNQQ